MVVSRRILKEYAAGGSCGPAFPLMSTGSLRRTACVWVTRATWRPSASWTSVSTTIVDLPLCRRWDVAATWPSRTAPKKFDFDSIVAVPFASSGRLRNAQRPPPESARLMIAPPCSTPPDVQRSSAHASRSTTSSGDAETSSTPSRLPNGMA